MEFFINYLSPRSASLFSPEKYRPAKRWYREQFNVDCKDPEILNYIASNNTETLTTDDIISQFCFVNCICEVNYDDNNICDIKKKCLYKRGKFYTCLQLPFVYEYYLLYKDIPTDEQLSEIVQRAYEFNRNPEEFHAKDKILVPTLNLDKLSPIVKDRPVDDNCSLCQSDIGTKPFYKIPPCNHLFHANAEDCLGESTIINWLSNHKQCPNCKTIVQIPSE